MSQQVLTLKLKGLFTNSNQFSAVPDGALTIANNLVIDKDSIGESRRGFNRVTYSLPSLTDRADKLLQYQGKLLVHYNTSSLGFYDPSTGLTPYAGIYNHPDPLLAKIRSVEANQNLYFTSGTGIQKLDKVTNTPAQAGMYPGLDCKATASTNASGFMPTATQVAYRIVWGITDANSNLVLGAPSMRAIVANVSGGNQDISFTSTIPSGITTNHLFQIYRSNLSASGTTVPDDNMQLVYGGNPTSAQIAAKSLTIIDSTPDTLKGAALYTNDSQDGILQANEMPPYAADLASFRNCLFYANVKTKQSLIFNVLSVGGANGVQLADTITIAGTTYTSAAAENVSLLQYALVTAGSPAQNINDTALSLIRVINQNATNTQVYARYLSSSSSLPGQIQIQERILGGAAYYITASAHGTAFSPALPTAGISVASGNSVNLNGLMYSKQQIPEAVPILNILYVGSASKKILRILALRDSLIILKEDGVYRCTGTSPANFTIDLLDSAAILLAPETAVTANNKIYGLFSQGVCSVTDTGVDVISRPIEDSIRSLFGPVLPALQAYSFGVSYESDRKYILWCVSTSGDTYATQAFVFNIFTGAWTRWTRAQQHGVVLSLDDRIYVCDPTSNYLIQERKNFNFQDYSDESLPITITAATSTTLTLSTIVGVSIGDSVYQTSSINSLITSINQLTGVVTMADSFTWAVGASILLKSIPVLVEFNAVMAGNPGELKHYREVILLFKQNNFSTASINFYSDISGSTESVKFTGSSIYGWGRFTWGTGSPWGGQVRTTAFRTYVPLEKQRCDLLSIQFSCQNVWARMQIEGMSILLSSLSERVNQ